MKNKTIYLLLGPKGSGKSFIGALMEREFGVKFIRVEAWIKDLKGDRNIENDFYLREVFETIEKGVRKSLITHDKLVFESTGLTDYFDQMFQSLKQEFRLIAIGVYAPNSLCLRRVKKRDQSIHISISDEMVDAINKQVIEKQIETDFMIVNEDRSREQLIEKLSEILDECQLH